MFSILGNVVSRWWAVLLAAWVAALGVSFYFAPPWNEVAQDKELGFLPGNVPSRIGEEEFQKAFPQEAVGSNVVVVLKSDGGKAALAAGKQFIEDDLEPGLRKIAESEGGLAGQASADAPLFSDDGEPAAKATSQRSIISRIQTPNAPGSGALLESEDGKALLVVLDLTTEFLADRNWPTISRIEGLISNLQDEGKVPAGTKIFVTGSAVLGRDHVSGELQSARATEWLTVLLVVGLLFLIYRAPLLAVIPILTVFLAVELSLNLLAILGGQGYLTIFQGIQIYVIVLVCGTGVDYFLFVMARYKEELHHGVEAHEALRKTVGQVGSVIAASTATVMCGVGMMVFAEFGKFQQAGIAIPLSLFIGLCATLTFGTALLRLAGRWAFWPELPRRSRDEARLVPARWYSRVFHVTACEHGWKWLSRQLLRRPGTLWLVFVAVLAPFAVFGTFFAGQPAYDMVANLPADLPSVKGVHVLEKHFSRGVLGTVSILLVDPDADFRTEQGREMVARVTDRLCAEKGDLGLFDVRSLTKPLGITPQAALGFVGLDVPPDMREAALRSTALERYATDFGERARTGTRLDVVLDQNPLSHRAIEDLDRLEKTVEAAVPAGTKVYVVGATASIRDLSVVRDHDHQRISLLVLGGVYAILVLLLRQPVTALYLILSVLFSYYATLGGTYLVFWALDPHGFTGLDWKVSTFLFTILIAVGEDYNIFLTSRVREEQGRRGALRGIAHAMLRTGPIISTCGIIMAGTFSSLLAGSLSEMKQLGFALAAGVLLDTFVVRPLLVPSFLVLRERLRRRQVAAKLPVRLRQAPARHVYHGD